MLNFEKNLSERLSLQPIYSSVGVAAAMYNIHSDHNNKHKRDSDKYSLRPRTTRKRATLVVQQVGDIDRVVLPPVTISTISTISSSSASKIAITKASANVLPKSLAKPACKTKAKQKSAPLSKYRRKTANARERDRMREINQAFEVLRQAVPQLTAAPHASNTNTANEKLTKITTLRLAMKYISALSAVLLNGGDGYPTSTASKTSSMFSSFTMSSSPSPSSTPSDSGSLSSAGANSPLSTDFLTGCGEFDSLLLESDGESLPFQQDFSDNPTSLMDFAAEDFVPLPPPDLANHLTNFDPFLSDMS